MNKLTNLALLASLFLPQAVMAAPKKATASKPITAPTPIKSSPSLTSLLQTANAVLFASTVPRDTVVVWVPSLEQNGQAIVERSAETGVFTVQLSAFALAEVPPSQVEDLLLRSLIRINFLQEISIKRTALSMGEYETREVERLKLVMQLVRQLAPQVPVDLLR